MAMRFSFLFAIILLIVILFLVYRVRRIIYLEKRLRRYSVMSVHDDISFLDRVEQKYRMFLSRFYNDENIKKHSSSYKKYVTLGENESPVFFLLHKLVIGFVFS